MCVGMVVGVALCSAPAAAAVSGAREPSFETLARLGRLMFFDPSLSASGRLACGTCHDPKYAYGPPPGKALAFGGKDMNQPGTRAVPSLRYLNGAPAFQESHRFADGDVGPVGGLTWDGRAASLRDQAAIPLLAANEMANRSPKDIVAKLRRSAYAAQFRAAFGADIFDHAQRAYEAGLAALEAFQQVPEEFYPYTSRYDAFLRGELELTEAEERGARLFKDPAKGNCASCHLGVSRRGAPPPFTDFDFVNVGVPRNARIAANADPHYYDLGLCGPQRKDFADRREYCGFFRSPTLRNSAIREAFFHNGVFHSLREVLEFYNERDLHPEKFYPRNPDGSVHAFDDMPPGFPDNVDHDPPLDRKPGAEPALTPADIDDLIAFLGTLTDGYSQAGAPVVEPRIGRTLDWSRPWEPPHDAADAANHSDEYAWRLFVALNWPADSVGRVADSRARLGADRPVVWETWQNTGAVYLAAGQDPGPWLPGDPARPLSPERRFETVSSKDLPVMRHIVAGVMTPLLDPVASARRLTEIRMNRTAFEFIRGRRLYSIEGQLRAAAGGAVSFPPWAREVKAKWRPIDPAEAARYHTVTITLADGTRRLFGLTALHILSKDLPNWFWATFEQVDNPDLPGAEGWQLASRDRFACGGMADDCNRAPSGVGLEDTVWRYYRLRGTMTAYLDADGRPQRLANSELETGMQTTASCMTCHARASIGLVAGAPARLPIFDDERSRRGFVGLPQSQWYRAATDAAGGVEYCGFRPLDFVWSLSLAQRGPGYEGTHHE